MKVDLSCPVEVRGFDLAVFDHGAPRAYLKLYNLASEEVRRIRAIAHWADRDGHAEDMPFTASQLHAGPCGEFSLSLSPENLNAVEVEIEFLQVRFEGERPDWMAGEGTVVDLPPPEPINARDEALLLRVAGNGATQYARLIPGAWLCVCGRANSLGAAQCARCRRGRDICLARFTRGTAALNPPPLPDSVVEPLREPTLPFAVNGKTRKRRVPRHVLVLRAVVLALLALLIALFVYVQNTSDGGGAEATPPPVSIQSNACRKISRDTGRAWMGS